MFPLSTTSNLSINPTRGTIRTKRFSLSVASDLNHENLQNASPPPSKSIRSVQKDETYIYDYEETNTYSSVPSANKSKHILQPTTLFCCQWHFVKPLMR
jgi:hypothetical protein